VILALMVIGAWVLARWVWRAVRKPFRGRTHKSSPKGLGSDYEVMVRQNGGPKRASTAGGPILGTVGSNAVTPSHYERLVSRPATADRRRDRVPAPMQLGPGVVSSGETASDRSMQRHATTGTERKAADRLRQLDDLKQAGLVTDEEYARKRAEVMRTL
jgi:Short C-terminal domain